MPEETRERMTELGPEAILMTTAIAARREMAREARAAERGAAERQAELPCWWDFEEMPRRSVVRDLWERGTHALRRTGRGAAARPALVVGMAALPGFQAADEEERLAPLSALPVSPRP